MELTRVRGGLGRGASVGAALACAALGSACLAADPQTISADARAVAVEPRVIMDGSVELGQREGERLVIDEVVFHAPGVVERRGDLAEDVLATDPDGGDPLLFRYDIASEDGFGDVLGGARRWVLHAGDERTTLEFSFSPFALDDAARARLEDAAGVDLAALDGHTAFVHGYVAMSAQGVGFGNECDGDPDGNPADCRRKDGDPDGNPGGPSPENDGDPDGNPAHPRRSELDFKGQGDDAQGEAAAADDSDGDPDGNPAKPGMHGLSEDELAVQGTPFDDGVGASTPVPFVLVLNDAFALQVPVASLLAPDIDEDAGEVLPIDLHISLTELFSAEQVAAIRAQAASQSRGTVTLVASGGSSVGIDVRASGVRRAAESATSGGIRVVGDLR